ncbi:MAG TPA: SAM-dependent chlorinase/fluorinase [Tepidisphaeraceae bacterium]|jgi:S-adenosylmethionine hydrolase
MLAQMAGTSPCITLLSDFGTEDAYVAAMKGMLIRYCPGARLVDITHAIAPRDILAGSFALERAIDSFPAGTVHLAVVDPGVGGTRRILLAAISQQLVVCPDNGLITWAVRRHPPCACHELTWRPARFSGTFHGRDIMAPAAAMLARDGGEAIAALAQGSADPVLLDVTPASRRSRTTRIIHIDHFGNATTNMPESVLGGLRPAGIIVGGRKIGRVRHTYGDVPSGRPLALIGGAGLLEIAVRDGHAGRELSLHIGDGVEIVCN